jgi:hypothetical protein
VLSMCVFLVQEVILNADGTRTLLTHEPAAALYPSSSTAGQLLQAAQMCAFNSLQLEEQQQGQAAAAAAEGGEDADADSAQGPNGVLLHLTQAQRASMSVRTFNLRCVLGFAAEVCLTNCYAHAGGGGVVQSGQHSVSNAACSNSRGRRGGGS